MPEIKSYLSIERTRKIPVLKRGVVSAIDPDTQLTSDRYIFQVPFTEGVARGNSLTYLGQHFTIVAVNDTNRLRGLEIVSELGPR